MAELDLLGLGGSDTVQGHAGRDPAAIGNEGSVIGAVHDDELLRSASDESRLPGDDRKSGKRLSGRAQRPSDTHWSVASQSV